ncbi:hypothetical protein [Novosphingobium sp. LASN5T]|nr:hypothetical protein [Novosphingobium sp. LASN5T]
MFQDGLPGKYVALALLRGNDPDTVRQIQESESADDGDEAGKAG